MLHLNGCLAGLYGISMSNYKFTNHAFYNPLRGWKYSKWYVGSITLYTASVPKSLSHITGVFLKICAKWCISFASTSALLLVNSLYLRVSFEISSKYQFTSSGIGTQAWVQQSILLSNIPLTLMSVHAGPIPIHFKLPCYQKH